MKKLTVILISLAVLVGRADAQNVVRRAGVQDFKYQVGDFYRKSRLALGDSVRLDGITPINALSRGIDSYGLVACSDSLNALIVEVGEAGGGDIYLPPGYYRVKEPITIEFDNVRLIGSGGKSTVIFPTWDGADDADFHNTLRILHSNNVTISHVGVKGARCTGACENSGIAIEGGINNTISYCWADSCDNAGILVGYDRNRFIELTPGTGAGERYEAGSAMIDSIDGWGHIIIGNIITNTTNGAGIEVCRADSCIVSNNYINASWAGYGIRVAGAHGTSVVGNQIVWSSNEAISIQGSGDTVAGANTGVVKASEGTTITGNVIGNCGAGIRIFNSSYQVLISSNVMKFPLVTGDPYSTAVGVKLDPYRQTGAYGGFDYAWRDVTINDNSIIGGSSGIIVQGQGDGLQIKDNSIGEWRYYGISLDSDITVDGFSCDDGIVMRGVSVDGNRIWIEDREPTEASRKCINVDGDSIYVSIGRNSFSFPTEMAQNSGAFYSTGDSQTPGPFIKMSEQVAGDFGITGEGGSEDLKNLNRITANLYWMSGGDSLTNNDRGIDLYFSGGPYTKPSGSLWPALRGTRIAGPAAPEWLIGGNPRLIQGYGAPTLSTAGPPGSLYQRQDRGPVTDRLYVKQDSVTWRTVVGNGTTIDMVKVGADSIVVGTARIYSGNRTPNGVIAAPLGSMYLRTSDTDSLFWIKGTDSSNTGWVLK